MSFGFIRNRHILKSGLFSAIVFFSVQAAISAPLFVVEKVLEPQRMTVTITSSQVPELKGITFTCSYAMPKASLMEAIVSSPQPGTALSVMVDSATSTLSITIQAATTLTPAENARIIMLRIPATASFNTSDFAVTSAVIFNKAGTPTTVAVNNKSSGIGSPFPAVAVFSRQRTPSSIARYCINGRKVSGTLQNGPCGISVLQQDGLRIASILSVR